MRRWLVQAAVLVAALALVGSAFATKPPAYQGTAGKVQNQVQAGAVAGTAKTVGQLPFTGIQLTLFAGGGLALVVAGASLRRLGRKRQ